VAYTRCFGFRDFSNIIRDGRNAVPTGLSGADANGYLLGTGVTLDPSNAGYLVRPSNGAAPTQLSGLAVYEHIQFQGVDPFLTTQYDPPFNVAPSGRMAQVVHGVGVKVWFKNTPDSTEYDGRTEVGATYITTSLGSLSIGSGLKVGANGTWVLSTDSTGADWWLVVESVNATTGLVEARLTF